ncbi:MAG TPA: hypothetical protein VGW80_01060 [Solirubrobacterales bacterium]|jgi:hypothetical protein|nr:hypothetical protein [Solirubrobacterales bacterium]
MRRGLRTTILCFACLGILALPGSAAAAIEVESFLFDASTAQAGAHPDLTVHVSFAEPGAPETAQDAVVQLPPGLFLYPGTLPRCGPQQLADDECPIDSQVGVVDVQVASFGSLEKTPVYLAVPEPGEVARLAFHSLGFAEPLEVPVRAGAASGYSLSLAFEELPEAMPIASLELALWGVPPAPIHDEERGPHASEIPGGRQANIPQTPFTRNPTACGATSASVTANSYEEPDEFSTATASGPTVTGCDKLAFEPASAFALSSAETASAAGIGMEYQLPQDLTPHGLATSDTEAIALYLPGLAVNEAAASQQATCTLAEANLATEDPSACPAASKIGTFSTALAAGDGALEGGIYFGGAESPSEYRLFLAAGGAGPELKLPAWLVSAGSEAELVIPELPQLPLEELDLQVDPAASLFLTPPQCGTFEALTEAFDWSRSDFAFVMPTPFTIDSGPGSGPCPSPADKATSTPKPSAPALPAPAQNPIVKLRRHPVHHGHDRTPTFRFVSSIAGSTFQCKIDRRPWRPCHSPLTLHKLRFGSHVFRVKALAAAGAASPVVTYRFIVARP